MEETDDRSSYSSSVYFSEFLYYKQEMRKSIVQRNRKWKKKQFKETKTLISSSFCIRHSFQENNWRSDNNIFEWRVTWNYTHSPFNASELLMKLERMKMEKLINTFITRVKPIQNYWSRNCSCSHCCIIPGFFLTKKEGERMIKL